MVRRRGLLLGGLAMRLVGPAAFERPPRRARDTAAAARLWAEAERLTGVRLPAGAIRS